MVVSTLPVSLYQKENGVRNGVIIIYANDDMALCVIMKGLNFLPNDF